MKASVKIEGKHGSVEITADTSGMYKGLDGDVGFLRELGKQARENYDHLKKQREEGQQ